MDAELYRIWQALHRRAVLGEALTDAEQSIYDIGCRELDAEERLDGDLIRLRELRTDINVAESEQRRLREHEAELDQQIKALEGSLDQRTRQLLGVTS